MKIPKESPQGIQFITKDDGGAWLVVEEDLPFWQFWRTGRVAVALDKFGLIWLYQTAAKLTRRGVVEEGYDQLADDLRRAYMVADGSPSDTYEHRWYMAVAQQLRAKGWVKM